MEDKKYIQTLSVEELVGVFQLLKTPTKKQIFEEMGTSFIKSLEKSVKPAETRVFHIF